VIADEPLPPWALRLSDGNYMEVGAQLATRNGRKIGNAVVSSIADNIATVTTDRGSIVRLYPSELAEMFYPPRYIMDPDYDKLKEPT
jgi:hypothetical protein